MHCQCHVPLSALLSAHTLLNLGSVSTQLGLLRIIVAPVTNPYNLMAIFGMPHCSFWTGRKRLQVPCTALRGTALRCTALELTGPFTWPIEFVQEDRERPYKTVEQRLAAYRQECEARLQEEVQRQVHPRICKAAWFAQPTLPAQWHPAVYLADMIDGVAGVAVIEPV